uniref:Uncharacterized protein n=1 Tax=Cacopsylla melanoneura TaxID=428564 RepID=A0A8D8LQE9_9HEMI
MVNWYLESTRKCIIRVCSFFCFVLFCYCCFGVSVSPSSQSSLLHPSAKILPCHCHSVFLCSDFTLLACNLYPYPVVCSGFRLPKLSFVCVRNQWISVSTVFFLSYLNLFETSRQGLQHTPSIPV